MRKKGRRKEEELRKAPLKKRIKADTAPNRGG
jgi:hypothetical protein